MLVADLLALMLVASGSVPQKEEARSPTLEQLFAAPPPSYRPLIIVHYWPLHQPEVLEQLDGFGPGGLVLDAGITSGSTDIGDEPFNNPTYLNDPEQFERLRSTISELRSRDQTVWIYDEYGYPSASAGGRVLNGHPEFQVTAVSCRTFAPDTNGLVQVQVDHPEVETCLAMLPGTDPLAGPDCVDLTDKARAGSFEWEAPDPEWRVHLCERYQPDTWSRHNIPRRIVNILDRNAIQRFIQLTHEAYARELGPLLKEVELFFTDEPQLAACEPWITGLPEAPPRIQWCSELAEVFRSQKGYELASIWPALFVDVGPLTPKYRFDFYDVQTRLIAENYFGQIEDWCHGHGVASSGHMLLEESLLFHVMFSGSMLRNWDRMDLPGVDLLGAHPYHTMGGWNLPDNPVPEDFSCKLASSVAHLRNKPGVFTESFAVAKGVTLRQAKGVAAWQFSGGVTHMSTYTLQEEISPEAYAEFAKFVGRLAVLTRRGQPRAEVLVLVPEASVWASYTPPDGGQFPHYAQCNPDPIAIDAVFRSTCHELLQHQRDFECCSEDLLAEMQVDADRLILGDQSFGALILPEARMLRADTLAQVTEFLAGGGVLGVVGSLPSQSPANGADPALTAVFSDLLAGYPAQVQRCTTTADLPELVEWLEQVQPPQVRWHGPTSVRLLERYEPNRAVYLLANPGSEAVSGQLEVPHGGSVSLWDPESGAITEVSDVVPTEGFIVQVQSESAVFLVCEYNQ